MSEEREELIKSLNLIKVEYIEKDDWCFTYYLDRDGDKINLTIKGASGFQKDFRFIEPMVEIIFYDININMNIHEFMMSKIDKIVNLANKMFLGDDDSEKSN